MPKTIRYSKHAERKLVERNIDKDSVKDAILKPTKILSGRGETKITQKAIGSKILRVIFREEENHYIVVTAYITVKERYG